jgi:dipeptidase E
MLILTSSNNYVTSDFITHLPKSPSEMRLTYIPTATEVEKGDTQWSDDDRQALIDAGFQVSDFTVTGKNKQEVQQMLDNTDFVFVSGGNTFYLLQEMRKSGFAELIKGYVDNGLLYGGTSAGSVVAGPDIALIKGLDNPALAPELSDYTGLGLVDVVVLPHWGSAHFQDRYQKMMQSGYKKGLKLVLLTDDQYLLVNENTYTIESI